MPFGLTNASPTFQRAVHILLSGVKRQFCLVYLDNSIVYSRAEEEHVLCVDKVLSTLPKAEPPKEQFLPQIGGLSWTQGSTGPARGANEKQRRSGRFQVPYNADLSARFFRPV